MTSDDAALALDEYIRVKPGDSRLSVKAEQAKSGHLQFTIARDSCKNPDHARNGRLTLAGDDGFLAQFPVEAEERERQITYRIEMSKEALKHSTFLLREYRPSKDGEPLQLGGATVFEIRFGDFGADTAAPAKEAPAPSRVRTTGSTERREAGHVRGDLDDGVYPVVSDGEKAPKADEKDKVIELTTVPVDEKDAPQKIRLFNQPLLRFENVADFDFTFENGECTEIGFQNTDELKKHTRDHVGSRLAVVIDNRVVSHHKIREAIESPTVRITCCTVGGGDHLHKHLKKLKADSQRLSTVVQLTPKNVEKQPHRIEVVAGDSGLAITALGEPPPRRFRVTVAPREPKSRLKVTGSYLSVIDGTRAVCRCQLAAQQDGSATTFEFEVNPAIWRSPGSASRQQRSTVRNVRCSRRETEAQRTSLRSGVFRRRVRSESNADITRFGHIDRWSLCHSARGRRPAFLRSLPSSARHRRGSPREAGRPLAPMRTSQRRHGTTEPLYIIFPEQCCLCWLDSEGPRRQHRLALGNAAGVFGGFP
jgi:hypothetical protein